MTTNLLSDEKRISRDRTEKMQYQKTKNDFCKIIASSICTSNNGSYLCKYRYAHPNTRNIDTQ